MGRQSLLKAVMAAGIAGLVLAAPAANAWDDSRSGIIIQFGFHSGFHDGFGVHGFHQREFRGGYGRGHRYGYGHRRHHGYGHRYGGHHNHFRHRHDFRRHRFGHGPKARARFR
ncbi:MAG: hypothetical protein PVF40_01440 [Ectothiorhodospiraceae bacterium]